MVRQIPCSESSAIWYRQSLTRDILRMAKHASEAIRASNIKEMDRILELHLNGLRFERIRAFEAFTSGPNHRQACADRSH